MTKVLKCNCHNVVQDRLYGRGFRLFNGGKVKENGKIPFYCTCCGCKISFRQLIEIDFENGKIRVTGLMRL